MNVNAFAIDAELQIGRFRTVELLPESLRNRQEVVGLWNQTRRLDTQPAQTRTSEKMKNKNKKKQSKQNLTLRQEAPHHGGGGEAGEDVVGVGEVRQEGQGDGLAPTLTPHVHLTDEHQR